MRSVLQGWVMSLPLREQGTLLTVVRGCDLTPKLPLDSTERQLVAYARFCFMVPADIREVDVVGAFYKSTPPEDWRASELGHYPLHWFTHLMHAYEVIAHRCPNNVVAANAWGIYDRLVRSLHLLPEPLEHMIERLSEDRIAKGEVVS